MALNILLFIGGMGTSEIFIVSLLMLIPAILFIWAIVDLLGSHFGDSIVKLIWALVIIFLPFLGSILYLVVGRRQKV